MLGSCGMTDARAVCVLLQRFALMLRTAHPLTTFPLAAEGSGTSVVSVGDKGRSQLLRTEGKTFALSVADTYKVRVTFGQASGGLGGECRA